jgi:hypothetical protein
MKEIDDKVDYEPGLPESISFLKALAFLSSIVLHLCIWATIGGFCAYWLAWLPPLSIRNQEEGQLPVMFGAVLGLLAASSSIRYLHRRFYR